MSSTHAFSKALELLNYMYFFGKLQSFPKYIEVFPRAFQITYMISL